MFIPAALWAQDGILVLKGRVTAGGHGVPYATVQLIGTAIGVSCNDDGEYTLKVPETHRADSVLVRSMGYESVRLPISILLKHNNIRLKPQEVELKEVVVKSYRDGNHLLKAAIKKINENYHRRMTRSTFFYRDWRAVDNELYVFDEAVMNVMRSGYGHNDNKRFYRFDPNIREMASDYKTILRHRMLVYDRRMLEERVNDRDGVDGLLSFSENELFFDLLEAPKASYATLWRLHYFEPVQEFVDNGEVYYLVRSKGVGRYRAATVIYNYVIRKNDLAIVRISTSLVPLSMTAPSEAWVGVHYNKLYIDADSSAWTYDVRDGRYTLTHYYNTHSYRLTSRFVSIPEQRWQRCIDWTLTDFSTTVDTLTADTLAVRQQTLMGAFGKSDYDNDYWGHYNTVPIDTLSLQMLRVKLTAKQRKDK